MFQEEERPWELNVCSWEWKDAENWMFVLESGKMLRTECLFLRVERCWELNVCSWEWKDIMKSSTMILKTVDWINYSITARSQIDINLSW